MSAMVQQDKTRIGDVLVPVLKSSHVQVSKAIAIEIAPACSSRNAVRHGWKRHRLERGTLVIEEQLFQGIGKQVYITVVVVVSRNDTAYSFRLDKLLPLVVSPYKSARTKVCPTIVVDIHPARRIVANVNPKIFELGLAPVANGRGKKQQQHVAIIGAIVALG